ncbi:MAG: Tol-Pal system beta propeller repeat protein TolB [Coxiella sp. RIFCSPHIGHO2_12_FULL_44_14]|nr:MAG: Tol-Pal system beta propeller repeat protein TolB [Coxiella sp. RIFCSPHIGHO2_12_FULL_44_14]
MWLRTLFLLICTIGIPWHATALDLELTQGIRAALPIAILPFAGSGDGSSEATLVEVIRNDLQNSGQFRVVSAEMGEGYDHWRAAGVNNVVTGAIYPQGNHRYQVTFTLRDVFGGQNSHASPVLLSQTFHVGETTLRGLAHHISDLIYQKLTGVQGIFSTKIAYVLVQRSGGKTEDEGGSTKYTLIVADEDGFNPRPLLVSHQPIMSPSWSADARHLAYVSFENHRAAIYIQDLGTGQRRLVSNAPGINGAPAFSPEGQRLALVLTKTGNPKIYVMNLTTQELQEITFGWSIDTEPAWSPDSRSLLFTSNRDGNPQIYRYSFTTGQVSRVTYQGDYNARALFTPDARSVVMMHRNRGLFGIALQDLASSQLWVLAQTGVDESPSLAPNGKMIIYATQYGGRGVLAQVSTDGQIKLRLPAQEGDVQEPAWSPFMNS